MEKPTAPEGYELLEDSFVRQHEHHPLMADLMSCEKEHVTTWTHTRIKRSDILNVAGYYFAARIGTTAALLTPLPEPRCDCGAELAHDRECSTHRRHRHVLPHELAAMATKPEGLVWALKATTEWHTWTDDKGWPIKWNGEYQPHYAYALPITATTETEKVIGCQCEKPLVGGWGTHCLRCHQPFRTIKPKDDAAPPKSNPSGVAAPWLPIADAPRDGTWVEGRHKEQAPFECGWNNDDWWDRNGLIRKPTHFRLIPALPQPGTGTPRTDEVTAKCWAFIDTARTDFEARAFLKAQFHHLSDHARTLEQELAQAVAERDRVNARLLDIHHAVGRYAFGAPSPIDAIKQVSVLRAELATVKAERDALRESEERAMEFCVGLSLSDPKQWPLKLWEARKKLLAITDTINVFETKERGIPQAHIAAELVRELRAALLARAEPFDKACSVLKGGK